MSLLSPLSFRTGLSTKNRVALAPMTNLQSHRDGTLSDDELRWLCSRADAGFGIVFTCASHVSADGQGWPGELACFSDAHLDGLSRVAAAMRARGAVSMLQIFHGGARADKTLVAPWGAVAEEGVRAGSLSDITRLVHNFADAAARAERAGFDGVEIHGAHGYVLTQFLSATNIRSDGYGGTFDGRVRLLREVVVAVRARVSPAFTVGVRLSPEDFGNAKGLDIDESVETARLAAIDGADIIHVSLWDASKNTTKRPDVHALPLFRAAVPHDVRIVTAGSIWTRDDAMRALERGADVVALGRSAVVNPAWIADVAERGGEPVRPPVSRSHLLQSGLSPSFADYMARWKGFVSV
jgi:2,4-dienoyl-CoA reductase-like NADH-dependent reductase (Old Yellow Enzyme family)